MVRVIIAIIVVIVVGALIAGGVGFRKFKKVPTNYQGRRSDKR